VAVGGRVWVLWRRRPGDLGRACSCHRPANPTPACRNPPPQIRAGVLGFEEATPVVVDEEEEEAVDDSITELAAALMGRSEDETPQAYRRKWVGG
jgi:hypothetical protein